MIAAIRDALSWEVWSLLLEFHGFTIWALNHGLVIQKQEVKIIVVCGGNHEDYVSTGSGLFAFESGSRAS